MEFQKSKDETNPWTNANCFSRIFFWWLTPLFIKGWKGNLKLTDLYDCPKVDSSENTGNRVQKEWNKELMKLKSNNQPSLLKATIRAFGLEYSLNLLLMSIQECFIVVSQSILLGYMIRHFARMEILPQPYYYLISAVFCLLSSPVLFLFHQPMFSSQRIAMKLRTACCSLIYKKALNLSQSSLSKTTVGQMVNLLSNDVNKFDQAAPVFPYLFVGPAQAVVIVCVLWMYIGYASFAVICVLLFFISVQSGMGKLFSKFRSKTAILTDERIRLMNEIIGGMRVIKMFGWEIPFTKLVNLSRRKEVQMIRQTWFLHGINVAITFVSTKIILLIAFAVFLMIAEEDLTPENVFVFISLVNNIDRTCTVCFSMAVASTAGCLISLKRIQKFLLLEEKSETSLLDVSNLRPKIQRCGIWMNKVKASWNKDGKATLCDVTLTVRPGDLLIIVGPVGCGKSSLLMSILGELPIVSGEITVRGQVAYASQDPWVFGGTIKENIIFESHFDEIRYRKVLGVCALEKDIEQFPCGDQTIVGERGVILSGGQKARVSLARAMYFDADVFLLDDPLSAVDTSVSKHLFEICINNYLKDKVRILATHQIQFLKKASQILVLKDGECLALGSYNDLINKGVDFGSLMDELKEDHCERSAFQDINTANTEIASENSSPVSLNGSTLSIKLSEPSVDDNHEKECSLHETSEKSLNVFEETKIFGTVSRKVYKDYFVSSPGPFLTFSVSILFIIAQSISIGSDFWLAAWTNLEQKKYYIKHCWTDFNKTSLNETLYCDSYGAFDQNLFRKIIANVSNECFTVTQNYTKDMYDAEKVVNMEFRLSVYAGLILGVFLLSLVRTIAFFGMCMKASISLHDKMFRRVLRAPVTFFDRNPVGRVLNRFSKDTGIIDDELPSVASLAIRIFCNVLGAICTVSIVEPYLLLSAAVIGTLVIFVRQLYVPTVRDVKRYDGITRSPVFSHLSNSMCGLTTIRAFKAQRAFEITFDHLQDQHTGSWFLFLAISRWLGIVLDCLCIIFLTSVTIAMVMLSKDPSYASACALAMTSVLQCMVSFQHFVRLSAEVEILMTSVERVVEYSNLETEAPLESEKHITLPEKWPYNGCITYRNVSLKYTPNEPPILKNLNFQIHPEEKVGIVGRTGAGKSSMVATLLRMSEPEGEIIIDGVCTKNIGLHDLRKKISIIPQDPVLFSGPVRKNLDPFSEYSDIDLWQALDEVHLKDCIEEMPGGLNTEVSEGGSNFSVGQRQLLCLARAVLRRNKILVLDEATANVDPNTDNLIQKTIRNRFEHCTVLTIAHRLHTIMDSDRVLVYDAGEIKEFDDPYILLQKPNGFFSQMVQMTGPAMAKKLHEVAHSAHQKSLYQKHRKLE